MWFYPTQDHRARSSILRQCALAPPPCLAPAHTALFSPEITLQHKLWLLHPWRQLPHLLSISSSSLAVGVSHVGAGGCVQAAGGLSVIPGGLRNHRPGLALPSPVWPTVTCTSEPSHPALCTTQTQQLTCGCLLVFTCSLFSQRGFSSSKWPDVSHQWCRSFPWMFFTCH